ncbi:SAM-dependent methyltransferase [Myxococcota bacterium]|nr:SAM-dependent methyltransferase [Myxococcota bacterium]
MDETTPSSPAPAIIHTVGDPGSRKRLTPPAAVHYPGTGLFDHIARVVCLADCMPRKELFEAWETARRTRRRLHGGRVVDMAAGHGLLAFMMLLIDDTSPCAIAVDIRKPAMHDKLAAAFVAEWPHLAGRVTFIEGRLETVELFPTDVVVSAHACGHLTDHILDMAIAARAAVSVLPCCHVTYAHHPLVSWMAPDLCVDVDRAHRLMAAGYEVRAQLIPEAVTPKNRLLIGSPTKKPPQHPRHARGRWAAPPPLK